MGGWAKTGRWFITNLMTNPANHKGEQLFSRDRGDAETMCQVIKNGFRRLKQDQKFLWRTREDGTLRAMMSDQYACVNNDSDTIRDEKGLFSRSATPQSVSF